MNLLWDNDARDADGADANLQIRNVELSAAPSAAPLSGLSRLGRDLCGSTGRWFYTDTGSMTFWSDQTAAYCFGADVVPGQYELSVEARNHGKLPPEYKRFRFYAATLAGGAYLDVPADDAEFRTGRALIEIPQGPFRLNLTWLNDHWDARGFDTNVEITRVSLRRVGDADSSVLVLLGVSGGAGQPLVVIVVGFLAAAALAGLFVWNWLRR
ncbi:MAG: hypothetical protein HY042_12750 [Spirochaetia bacterium]|nr:hypothetical protein [Spirochaetia bacterium]